MNKKYTLEGHLRRLANEDKDYELLCSIWELNKRNLTQGLNQISASFPHYSIHDVNHSMTIIDNIQCFLGEERMKRLSATDTFLIMMACLTHDIGMILMYNMVEEEWKRDDFESTLEDFAKSKDSVIADSARLLLDVKDKNGIDSVNDFSWALQVQNAVVVLTAEIFRSKHANQSATYLTGNGSFRLLANNFHAEQLPSRFMELLANVASLHGSDFNSVMKSLYFEANGYKGDYIHPRFIAYLIRLGDLLDFDNNRFNLYSRLSLKNVPETSKWHEEKHASVKHMLVSPNAIEAELDCSSEEVYRISRSWFDWLEEEVGNQSREWTNIAPRNLGGLPPVVSKGSIKILFNGIQGNSDLLNLKFNISQEKMFDILQGGGIYKEPGFVFIREIVQNAMDASKLQMWKDITDGFHDSCLLKDISFLDDIPNSIYWQYPVHLRVKWKDETQKVLLVECEDRGTGISESALLRMTNNVGESHKNDKDYHDTYINMPYFLRPTAAFGIGLQSVFFVAPKFEVETLFLGESSKRIIFRSAANNQYCSIVEENIQRKRGTTVRVEIPKERFSELFGSSFSMDVIDSTHIYEGKGDDVYLAKIDEFVRRTFEYAGFVNFSYQAENEDRSFCNVACQEEVNVVYDKVSEDGDFKLHVYKQGGFWCFLIHEKRYGSAIVLRFSNSIRLTNDLYRKLYLRDVVVSNASINYFMTQYLGCIWNLYSQSTDKVVDLSRDNLTTAGRKLVRETLLRDLLPQYLNLIYSYFEKKHGYLDSDEDSESYVVQYFNYCLSCYNYHLTCMNLNLLGDFHLPKIMVSKDRNDLLARDFFEAKEIYFVRGFSIDFKGIVREEKERFEDENFDLLKEKIVVWGDNNLHVALKFNFVCTKVVRCIGKYKIYQLTKSTDRLEVDIDDEEEYLMDLYPSSYKDHSRFIIYGLKKYHSIVVEITYISGFEIFPSFASCCIYSPFSEVEKVNTLLTAVEGINEDERKSYIRLHIDEYLSPALKKIVKENNINPEVTEEQIIEDYVALINDFVRVYHSKNQSKK